MSSRAAIFARLRAQSHVPPAAPTAYRPAVVDDLAVRLVERATSVLATGEIIARLDDLPAAAAAYLAARDLPREAAIARDLAHLAWGDAGLRVLEAPSRRSVTASVAYAPAAIAETGSLVLTSREAPWPNLLADTHIAVVPRSHIVPSFEEAVGRLAGNRLPRSLHVVTGPSRTGDIEQTLELGAHGAVRLHIVVVP
jgi:L-lactate dehydrogenase complex protein LldG